MNKANNIQIQSLLKVMKLTTKINEKKIKLVINHKKQKNLVTAQIKMPTILRLEMKNIRIHPLNSQEHIQI